MLFTIIIESVMPQHTEVLGFAFGA